MIQKEITLCITYDFMAFFWLATMNFKTQQSQDKYVGKLDTQINK